MGKIVSLVDIKKHGNIKKSIEKSFSIINYKIPKNLKKIILKPNLCYYWDSNTGYTTDPKVVEAIIDVIRENGNDGAQIYVAEADASAMRTKYSFKILGYEKLADEKDVLLLNLSELPKKRYKIKINSYEVDFNIPKIFNESDLFINIPKLKIMRHTHITCAMKNLFGIIPAKNKVKYHPKLNETIVAVNNILKPDLNIVDGIVSLGRHPIKLNLILTSEDAFSTDWVVSKIAGYDPTKIKFLKLSILEGLGKKDGIEIKGESIDKYVDIFPKESRLRSKYLWDAQLFLLDTYAKIVGDSVPPILQRTR